MSDLPEGRRRLFMAALPVAALVGVAIFGGVQRAAIGAALLALLWVAFTIGRGVAGATLGIFAGIAVALLVAAMLIGGQVAMWCVLGVGLFSSIQWSNIFSLAIARLGAATSQASSLLVMAILGGALLPPLQGLAADHIGLTLSFITPAVGFAYVAFYGFWGSKVGLR